MFGKIINELLLLALAALGVMYGAVVAYGFWHSRSPKSSTSNTIGCPPGQWPEQRDDQSLGHRH